MITKIYIENFKGIGSPGAEIELKPITLLFGANSAGKSTIFQALHYAREILKNKIIDPKLIEMGGIVNDYGGFENVINNQIRENRIKLRLDFKVKSSSIPYFDHSFEVDLENENPDNILTKLREEIDSAFIELEIYWDYNLERPQVNYSVGFNDEFFGEIKPSLRSIDNLQYIDRLNLQHPIFSYTDESGESGSLLQDLNDGLIIIGESLDVWFQHNAVPVWGKQLSFENSIFNYPEKDNELTYESSMASFNKERNVFLQALNIVFVGLGEILTNYLNDINYIGPIREIPDRKPDIGLMNNNVNWSNGLQAWELLKKNENDILDEVNKWLDYFKTNYEIIRREMKLVNTDTAIYRDILRGEFVDEEDLKGMFLNAESFVDLSFRDNDRKTIYKAIDIGVGISQILPIIVAAIHSQNTILAMEQPELHIHPRMQVELGDLFIQQINRKPNTIFIIETHSEHLMLRFLRRIKETIKGINEDINMQIYPHSLSIYFFNSNIHMSVCTKIDIDDRGRFASNWPDGFFDERYEEMI